MSENLYDLFASRFPADRNAPFLIGRHSVMTYGALEDLTGRMSAALRSAGAKPGDRIAAQIEKSAEGVALYLAAVRAGLVYLPLNTAYSDDEVAYFLRDSEPSIMVADPARAMPLSPASSAAAPAVLTLNADGDGSLSDLARTFDPDPSMFKAGPDDLVAILYSSGTTGKPKGAMLTHGNLASNALTLHKLWQFEPGDVLIHALPIFHVHGLFVALNTTLLNGSAVLFHEKFNVDAVLADMPRATLFMGVPTYYVRLLASAALTLESCSHMRLFISGSAPLLPETFDRFAERTGHQILERYGMTEAGMITSARPDRPRRAGQVGWPLPDVSVRVAPESGGIEIKGPNVFSGYWRQPDKTAEDFTADGYFKTGDLGAVGGDGAISIIGRAKDMFISGGFNVYPKEIETCIDAIPGVDESAVIGMPHPDFGEAGLAVVVMKAGTATLDEDIAQAALKRQLANYKIPKLFIVAQSLPRNTMGKVQKAQMRTSYAAAWRQHMIGE